MLLDWVDGQINKYTLDWVDGQVMFKYRSGHFTVFVKGYPLKFYTGSGQKKKQMKALIVVKKCHQGVAWSPSNGAPPPNKVKCVPRKFES